jgi:hypothetical protein
MAAPKKIDYERIEPDWRAGVKSPSQLAAEYTADTGVSVSHPAIIKHFTKLGVPRDLTAKVAAKAESMVLESMVTGKVSSVTNKTNADIVNGAAEEVATVILFERGDVKRGRMLLNRMMTVMEGKDDADLSIEAMKKMAETLRIMIGLEREVWNIESLSEKADAAAVKLASRLEDARRRAGK